MGIQNLARLTFLGWLLFPSILDLACAAQHMELPQKNSSSSVRADPFDATESGRDERLHIFTIDYEYVQIPYEVTLWILLASLAKIGESKCLRLNAKDVLGVSLGEHVEVSI